MMIILILVLIAVLRLCAAVEDYGGCRTANGEYARCVALEECNYLYDIIQNRNLTGDEVSYLRYSQCGSKDQQVLICCPEYFKWDARALAPGSGAHLLPSEPHCGVVVTNVVPNGRETAMEEFPWMALIEYTKPGDVKGHHCGGTLINSRYIITAAHCVVGQQIPSDWRLTAVRLGEWDTTTVPDCFRDERGKLDCAPAHLDIGVEEKTPHPQYALDSTDMANDIALLRLAQNVTYSHYIKPICLPRERTLRNVLFQGRNLDITGWGGNEYPHTNARKRSAIVKVWDWEKCQKTYRRMGVQLQPSQICAGSAADVDVCVGDSGGPLMTFAGEEGEAGTAFVLAGIASYGVQPCGLTGWPGVYTRVGAFIPWIESNLRV